MKNTNNGHGRKKPCFSDGVFFRTCACVGEGDIHKSRKPMLRSTSEHPINGNNATPPCCPSHNTSRALHPEAGFSLTELLVVLVIIGILALLAIPRFLNVTTKAKTSEAKLMLRNVHTPPADLLLRARPLRP